MAVDEDGHGEGAPDPVGDMVDLAPTGPKRRQPAPEPLRPNMPSSFWGEETEREEERELAGGGPVATILEPGRTSAWRVLRRQGERRGSGGCAGGGAPVSPLGGDASGVEGGNPLFDFAGIALLVCMILSGQ